MKKNRLTFLDLGGLGDLVSTDVDVGGQARDGLKVQQSGSKYVVDLGMFLPSDRFGKVKAPAGHTSGGAPLTANYNSASGKASFTAKPEKVTYRYDTGNGDPTRALAQKRAYTLQVTGTVAESARDTARIDAVRYKLEGSNEERRAPLGRDGNGILLKDMTDMTQKPGTPDPNSGGGCDAGVSGLALALAAAFLLKKKA